MSVSQLQQLENIWGKAIQQGNLLFEASAFIEAGPHYMEAVIASEVLMENGTSSWKHSLRVPGMYYTSCINMAHNYWGMQDVANAADYFLYCSYKLKMFSRKEHVSDLSKKSAFLYWLKTIKLYSEFSDQMGIPMPADMEKDDTYRQLDKLKDLFAIRKANLN
ncbi:MAG: hypothetical protein WKF70_10640 [Chitinophagaceae bacterium]